MQLLVHLRRPRGENILVNSGIIYQIWYHPLWKSKFESTMHTSHRRLELLNLVFGNANVVSRNTAISSEDCAIDFVMKMCREKFSEF